LHLGAAIALLVSNDSDLADPDAEARRVRDHHADADWCIMV
jgi:hypothetical protein